MTRTITNIILMILICFTLTAMPINKKLLTFDFSRFKIASSINQTTETDGVSFTYSVNEKESILFNPTDLTFEIRVESLDKNFDWVKEPQLVLEITDSQGYTNTISSTDFITSFSGNNVENPTLFTYTLDLSKTNLNLDNGSYNIKLYSDHESLNTSEPILLTLSYFEDINYISGITSANAKSNYLILYYSDNTKKHIVPIAREIPANNKVFRTTVNGLLEPPSVNLGLSVENIAPKISQIQYSNGLVTCYLKSSEVLPFSDDPVKAKNAIESLNRTIMDIQTPYAIKKIQYLVDRQPSKAFFNGTDLTEVITRKNNASVYLGLKTSTDRVLLVSKPLLNNDLETLMPNIIKILKTGVIPDQDSENLVSVLPEQVDLIDYKLEGVTLKLNFNSDLKNVFTDKDGISKLMLDSLSSTFASIDGIDNIEIQIDGKAINAIGNISFSSPIEPPKFTNPE